MKAKEFAKKLNDNPTLETLSEIGSVFLIECADLAKSRNAKSDAAMIAIFEEQDKKWRAFARRVDGVKPDGFEMLLKTEAPQAWAAWKVLKLNQARKR